MTISARNWAWDMGRRRAFPGELDRDGMPHAEGAWLPLKPGEKLTLICIAESENAELGYSFPSMDLIAEKTCQSVRTVQTHVDLLERMRAIQREKRRSIKGSWLRNVYVLNVPEEYREKDPEWVRHQG